MFIISMRRLGTFRPLVIFVTLCIRRYPFLPFAQQQITLFNEEDFAYTLGGPEPDDLVDNFQLRSVNLNQLPALEGQGISMTLINLGPCAINLPYVHPRATEAT